MAKKRSNNEGNVTISSEEKIARLLAMLLVKDKGADTEKVPLLRAAGFNTAEIGELLGTTDATVRAAEAYLRKKKAR